MESTWVVDIGLEMTNRKNCKPSPKSSPSRVPSVKTLNGALFVPHLVLGLLKLIFVMDAKKIDIFQAYCVQVGNLFLIFCPTAGLVVYWSVTRAVQWIQLRIWSRRRCFILTSQNSYNPLRSWSLIQLLWNELSRYSLPRVCAHNSCMICFPICIKNYLIFKHEF